MSLFSTPEKTITVPGGAPGGVTIRKLSRGQLKDMRKRSDDSGDADEFVLEQGIVSWAIDAPVSRETFDKLDPSESFFLIRAILTFSAEGATGVELKNA